MATFTKAQLRRIIKEEYEAVMNEDSGMFGPRNYDHSLVSNVSKTIEWDITQSFNFVLDLLEDVNAHTEYKAVKKVLWDSMEDINKFSEAKAQPVVTEGNEVSRMITKLELVLNTVDGAMGYIENPAAEQRFQKALDLGQELWDEMHNLLGEGKKKADYDDGEEQEGLE